MIDTFYNGDACDDGDISHDGDISYDREIFDDGDPFDNSTHATLPYGYVIHLIMRDTSDNEI
jgi:hypothetical protein